ncbi:hypothetical protein ACWATR_37175 [Nostoc sp. UIC 10890]
MNILELRVTDTNYEPEFTKAQVAEQLKCSPITVARYIKFGADYIPELMKYIDKEGNLNGTRILSSDIVFLEEIQDLKKSFSLNRVEQILNRKYQQITE